MTAMGEKGKLLPWDWDLRVRERHMAAGVIDHKDVEQHLSELPDLEAQADIVAIEQPAIGTSASRIADDKGSGGSQDEGPM